MVETREAPRPAAAGTVETTEALYAKLSPGPGRPAAEVAAHQCARVHGAMVELVAERGYDAVTVRELARLAGVSSRAFYQHFEGKQDCFLRTHELVARRAVKRIVASQAEGRDWEERLRMALDAFVRELEREPQAARFALVEAHLAGPGAIGQIRRLEFTFAEMLRESLSRAPDQPTVPSLLAEGIVFGLARVARARLVAEGDDNMQGLGGELVDWVLTYHSGAVSDLPRLDQQSAYFVPAGSELPPVPSSAERGEARTPDSDRALILSAVAKLATTQKHSDLTAERIRKATGVSRRRFHRNFRGVDDCLAAVVEHQAGLAFDQARRASTPARSWEGCIFRMVQSLCAQVAHDPAMAKLCFAYAFGVGKSAARCRERLMDAMEDLVRDCVPATRRPAELVTKASVGAVWGIARRYVSSGQAQLLTQAAATEGFLVLAPMLGPRVATSTLERELNHRIIGKHLIQKLDQPFAGLNGHAVGAPVVASH